MTLKRLIRVVKDFIFPEYWISVDWDWKCYQHTGKKRKDAFDWAAQYPAEGRVTIFRNYDVIGVRGGRSC